jgi:DNA-binding CsgD family transcriptional regulator
MILAGGLLERDEELSCISAGLCSALGGVGGTVVIEGLPGIGKTALCEAACAWASAGGLAVLKAAGAPLEQDFSYGVVRQLFEPILLRASADGRSGLFEGTARHAASMLLGRSGGDEGVPVDADRFYAVLHGLYGLTANLAATGPLLLVVDDAQWADPASQRFLFHLARRVERLAVLLLVALRSGERGSASEALAALHAIQGVRWVRPRSLSEAALERMVKDAIGPPDRCFVAACQKATGGVPYFVVELLATLARDKVQPTAAAAEQVSRIGPATVAHATVLRLARLGPTASAVARAVSVLGPQADPARVSALAALSPEEVLAAVDALVGGGLFAPEAPLRFAHPILQACVYDELAPGARDQAHRAAARILHEAGADPEEVAAHLLAMSMAPGAESRVLWAAARQALERGAPESAVAYLRRLATESGDPEARARVCYELGQAESLCRDPEAVTHLEEALRLSRDPRLRGLVTCSLVDVLGATGRWEERIPLIEAALGALGDSSLDVRLQLERRLAGVEAYDARYVDRFDRSEPVRRELLERRHPAGRELALLMGAVAAWRGRTSGEVARLVSAGLDDGRLLEEHGSSTPSLSQAVGALLLTEQIKEARSLVEDMLVDAGRRGSRSGLMQAHICRAWVLTQAGDLTSAEADVRAGVAMSREVGDLLGLVCALRFGLDALVERGCLGELAGGLADAEVGPGWRHTLTGCFLFEVRGHLLLERGQRHEAVECLQLAGDIYQALGFVNPIMMAWRPALALVVGAGQAEELLSAEVAAATRCGMPRALCRAYRIRALLEGGEQGVELLRRAAAEAGRCPSKLEQARCEVELGAAIRRRGQSGASRETLRSGWQLAEACGAERTAARALEELRLTGARPRRQALSGPSSLTPAELRVARLASQGLTNEQIAGALFVSRKTVENQLGHVYRKLGVAGRRQLEGVIGP